MYLYRYSWGYWRRIRVAEKSIFNGQEVFRLDYLAFHEPVIDKALTTRLDERQRFTYVSSDERGVLEHGGLFDYGPFQYEPPIFVPIGGRFGMGVTQEFRAHTQKVTGTETKSWTTRTVFLGEEPVTTDAGTFNRCARVRTRTPAESEYFSDDWYAPGIGRVKSVYGGGNVEEEGDKLVAAIVDGKRIP